MFSHFVSRNHVLSSKKIGRDADKINKACRQRKEGNHSLSLMKRWSELGMRDTCGFGLQSNCQ